MELVHKLVGVGPHGLHHVLHAGEILRQTGHLRAVAVDGHRPHHLPILPDGQAVGEHPAAGEGVDAHVVLRPPGFQQTAQGGGAVQLRYGPPDSGLLPVKAEELPSCLIHIDDLSAAVDGHDPLLERLQHYLLAAEELPEVIGLIAHEALLDPPRHPAGEQDPQKARRGGHQEKLQNGVPEQHPKAAGVDPHCHKAHHGAILPADRHKGAPLRCL